MDAIESSFFYLLEDIIADAHRIAVTSGTAARDRRHNASVDLSTDSAPQRFLINRPFAIFELFELRRTE